MRVLWYGRWYPLDGSSLYLRQVTRRLADMGHEVAVAYFGSAELDAGARDPRVEYLPLPCLRNGRPWVVESPSTGAAVDRWLREFRPHVVHACLSVGTFDLRLPAACTEHDIPALASVHMNFARTRSGHSLLAAAGYRLYGRMLRRLSGVVAFGPNQRDWLTRHGGVERRRVHVIPNGVNHVRFCPGRSSWRETVKEKFVVGYVGRLTPDRNIEQLCAGFLDAAVEDSRLVIVGSGLSSATIRHRFSGHARVTLMGEVLERDRVVDIMRGFDVFVLPAYLGGMSLALLEAMATGVVPVATDVGEHHSLVDGCGILVSPVRAADEICRALRELSAHPDRRQTLGSAARARARECGWDRTTERIVDLYRKVA